MIRAISILFALAVLTLFADTMKSAVGQEDSTPAAKKYQELLDRYEQEGGSRLFAKHFLELAEEYPDDPVAVDSLLWVVGNVRGRADTTRALELLTSQHVQSPKIDAACKDVVRSRSPAAEKLLRAVINKNPHTNVQASACYHLAKLLKSEASVIAQLKSAPDLVPRVLQYYGPDYGKHLAAISTDANAAQQEALYETMRMRFGTQRIQDVLLRDLAVNELFAIRNLSVGRVAPEIEGQDLSGETFKLSDYRGKVVMLTFWGHW